MSQTDRPTDRMTDHQPSWHSLEFPIQIASLYCLSLENAPLCPSTPLHTQHHPVSCPFYSKTNKMTRFRVVNKYVIRFQNNRLLDMATRVANKSNWSWRRERIGVERRSFTSLHPPSKNNQQDSRKEHDGRWNALKHTPTET